MDKEFVKNDNYRNPLSIEGGKGRGNRIKKYMKQHYQIQDMICEKKEYDNMI